MCHFEHFHSCDTVCSLAVVRGDGDYILCWSMSKLDLSSEKSPGLLKTNAELVVVLFGWECIGLIFFFLTWGFSLSNKMQQVAFRKLFQPRRPPVRSWVEECVNHLVHLGCNLFQLHSWFYQFFVSAMESSGSNLLCWVIHSFCRLSLLCWQLHLGEMFISMGIDLKVRALEAGCVLTAEQRRVLAQRLKSCFPLNQQQLAPKRLFWRSAYKTHLKNIP